MSLQAAAMGSTAGVQESGLLDKIIEESRVAQSDQEKNRARDIISELVNQVLEGEVVVSENLAASLDARVAELDRLISEQLSEVMHAPEFQALESAWTGLHYLCKQTSTGTQLKIKLFNANKRDLVKDFKTAIDFDQSALFKKVYEEEFGTFGGAPFGTLIGQYEISRQPEDMYFIDQMSHIAAAAHAPFIASAAPQLFGLDSYTELGRPRD
ncbi:MAG: type VI secretion system contractile sheath large subunit, partial [Dechloromonas sp.]|nr:type VI secretion system contractile sheath large subunit [Dechloromonas sp.]